MKGEMMSSMMYKMFPNFITEGKKKVKLKANKWVMVD